MRILLCVLSLFVLSSCNQAEQKAAATYGDVAMEEPAAIMDATAVNYAPPGPQVPKQSERKLIRNGEMSFEVDDVSATRQKIYALVDEFDGYIASEKRSADEDQPRQEQAIRIPGNQFEGFIAKVEGLAKTVDNEEFSAEDVTETYVDLQSRLVVQKELETRFRDIVKQAKTIEDILKVETEIGIVRNEIERIEGRLKYLSNQTSYSTITLTYYQPTSPIELPGAGSKFAESFLDGWDGFVGFLVGLTRTWPFLLVIGLITWLVIRRKRKNGWQFNTNG